MHTLVFALLSCVALAAAEPQYRPGFPAAAGYYLRSDGYPIGSIDEAVVKKEARLFFPSLTVTLTTVTTTSTATTTITCTSNAAGLGACSPTGRRRRSRREPMYNENEYGKQDEESFLIPLESKSQEKIEEPVKVAEEINRPVRRLPAVPFIVEPGFRSSLPVPAGRFLLSFGTSTTTVTTTSTATSTLVAVCASATSFPTCSSG